MNILAGIFFIVCAVITIIGLILPFQGGMSFISALVGISFGIAGIVVFFFNYDMLTIRILSICFVAVGGFGRLLGALMGENGSITGLILTVIGALGTLTMGVCCFCII